MLNCKQACWHRHASRLYASYPCFMSRALVGGHLPRLDARVGALRLQQQLHALDGRDHGLGHRTGHAASQEVAQEAERRRALPAPGLGRRW